MIPTPPRSTLRELLRYEPETGLLFWLERPRRYFSSDREWKRWNTRYAGTQAFTSIDTRGYAYGSIFGRLRLAHRIIWKMVKGREARNDIDHDDGNRTNNRLANLAAATRRQNCQNRSLRKTSKSGVMGVSWDTGSRKWRAQIKADGKQRHLGLFTTIEAAAAARKAADRHYGFHPNHGRQT